MGEIPFYEKNIFRFTLNNLYNESHRPLYKKMKLSIMGFFSKCDQIRRKLRIWSHLLKKSVMKKYFIFCAVDLHNNFLLESGE